MVERHVLDDEEETMSQLHPHPAESAADASGQAARGWWHRDHPVFTPLTGFFAGLLLTLVVPALFAAVLEAFFPQHTVTDLFPLVLVGLVVPLVLIARRPTRRFGVYVLLGIAATAAVVVGVAALTVWVMIGR
jgi:hypothetical protein